MAQQEKTPKELKEMQESIDLLRSVLMQKVESRTMLLINQLVDEELELESYCNQ